MLLARHTLTAPLAAILLCAAACSEPRKEDVAAATKETVVSPPAADTAIPDPQADGTGGFDEWDGDPATALLGPPEAGETVQGAIVTPIVDELATEAVQQVMSYWKKILRQCDDGWWYYQQPDGNPVHMSKTEPSFHLVTSRYIAPRTLSEADRLNGVDPQPVEWTGTIRARFELRRSLVCPINGTSGCFADNWLSEAIEDANVVRKHGKWEIEQQGHYPGYVAFQCSRLPALHSAIRSRFPSTSIYP